MKVVHHDCVTDFYTLRLETGQELDFLLSETLDQVPEQDQRECLSIAMTPPDFTTFFAQHEQEIIEEAIAWHWP